MREQSNRVALTDSAERTLYKTLYKTRQQMVVTHLDIDDLSFGTVHDRIGDKAGAPAGEILEDDHRSCGKQIVLTETHDSFVAQLAGNEPEQIGYESKHRIQDSGNPLEVTLPKRSVSCIEIPFAQ